MFTGLVETVGEIMVVTHSEESVTVGIMHGCSGFDVAVGGSVAVDGACLTMERRSGNMLFFTAVHETLSRTTLNRVKKGRKVNLERALPVGGRLDGHMVLGHVDGIGTLVHDRHVGNSVRRTFKIPSQLMPLMAPKGSVALDGVSLTIAEVGGDTITVSLIPHTMKTCTMGFLRPGDGVNIECDVVARYVQRLLSCGGRTEGGDVEPDEPSLLQVMKRSGF